MNLWSALVLIALITAVAWTMRARAPRAQDTHPDDEETLRAAEEAREQIEELKRRIATLEKIATDDRRKLELADEIEKLRDE